MFRLKGHYTGTIDSRYLEVQGTEILRDIRTSTYTVKIPVDFMVNTDNWLPAPLP